MKCKGWRVLITLFCFTMLLGCVNTHSESDFTADAYVSLDGQSHTQKEIPAFTSIQAAVDAAPETQQPWVIHIGPGTYTERVVINKPGIRLIGAGQGITRIAFGRYAGQAVASESDETWGTSRSATMEINSVGVSIFDLTIENTYDYPADDKLPKGHPDKISGTQAVALRTGEASDRTLLQRVELLGYQDTLYVKGGRTYVSDSDVSGHIDFIFGDGNALFEDVDIISLPRAHPMRYTGFVTAPSTLLENEYGLTFINCRLLRANGVPDGSVPLGRPWHPTTTFSDGRYANPFAVGNSTFIDTFMDAHIAPEGWTTMSGTAKDGSRKDFDPITEARFSEWGSYGPGAMDNPQRPQLSAEARNKYTIAKIFKGWQPKLLPKKSHIKLLN